MEINRIQNNSTVFQGKFIRNEILEKRINSIYSPDALKDMYNALKRMDAQKDGKIYKYIEESRDVENGIGGLDITTDTVAYITDKKGNKLQDMLISSESLYSDGCTNFEAPSDYLKDFICGFVKKFYPEKINKEEVRNNIFEILD